MESEIAGWLGVVFRFVHVLAAIMWVGNSLLFTWMELNLIAPEPADEPQPNDLLGHLDMLHGGGVFHLEKRLIQPHSIPVPLHWFMWQSYTTWISGVLLLVVTFYPNRGAALLDATKTNLTGPAAIGLSAGGILLWWLIYDLLWRTKLKDRPLLAAPLTLLLLLAAAWFYDQHFNGRAVYLQIGAMMGSAMTANVFFHIIQNQRKFMVSLIAGLPHDLKYGKQAKLRSLHNHTMTFPVLFLMLSGHFPQLTSAEHRIAILGVLVVSLVSVKLLMNSRYYFRRWLVAICGTFIAACAAIGFLLAPSSAHGTASETAIKAGARLFISQGCAACHQTGASQLAPNLQGVFNSQQILTDGSAVVADEAYLRQSIKQPQLDIVKGYAAAMPVLPLTDTQIDQLVAYVKSLK